MAMARLHDGPRRLAHWTVNSLQPQYPRGRALLLGVDLPRSQHKATEPVIATEESLAELARLAETAGYEPVRVITQRRDAPDPAHFVGSGKIDEIRAAAEESECDVLLFDHELSGIQARNLEEGTGLRVLDRTQLILEIFAARAEQGRQTAGRPRPPDVRASQADRARRRNVPPRRQRRPVHQGPRRDQARSRQASDPAAVRATCARRSRNCASTAPCTGKAGGGSRCR